MRISDWSSDVCSSDLTEGLRLPAFQLEGDDGAAAGHLATGDLGLRMVVAPGIKNPGHARFGGEEVGDGAGVAALALDAQVEGFQPLQQHPGVERAEAWAGEIGRAHV